MSTNQRPPTAPAWYKETKIFEKPSLGRAYGQIASTLLPFIAVWISAVVLMEFRVPYVFVLIPVLLAGLLLVRLFIIFHDCSHGSFFKSSKANAAWGWFIGVLTFTPFQGWKRAHGIHHATVADLDKRGIGDVWTLTLDEYRQKGFWTRLWYRIYRNPAMLFLVSPLVLFLVIHRFPERLARTAEHWSVHLTTAAAAILVLAMGFGLGWHVVLGVHLPMFFVSAVLGVWLFYVQHQFDPTYWEHTEDWDHFEAALQGSSHYKLPRILQWFSGNIGFHHIHHLRPRIPNYNLERCYKTVKELQLPNPLTLWHSLRCMTLHVWDEKDKLLLTFRQVRRMLRAERSFA
jgi:omega-6 fatty acid desaturase (delta-12 desaturase)